MNEEKELTLGELTGESTEPVVSSEPKVLSSKDLDELVPRKESDEPKYDSLVDMYCKTVGAEMVRKLHDEATELIIDNPNGVFDELLLDDEENEVKPEGASIERKYVVKEELESKHIEEPKKETYSIPVVKNETVPVKEVKTMVVKETPIKKSSTSLSIDDEEDYDEDYDLDDEYDEDGEEFGDMLDSFVNILDKKEENERFKNEIKNRIKPITEKLDLASFTINKSPVSVISAFKNEFNINPKHSADWGLLNTGTPITVLEMRAQDIESLNPSNSMKNRYNTYKDIFKTMYDHCISPNMPDFETFLKLVKYKDLDHLYFSFFLSSFNDVNIIPYNCSKCNKIDVVDIPKMDHVKYKDDVVKEAFQELINNNSGFIKKEYEVEVVQISDTFAAAIKEPSIYNVIIEPMSLHEKVRFKFARIIGLITYIDEFYFIDKVTRSLSPIKYKIDPDSVKNTYVNKIKEYAKILSELTSSQLSILTNIIGDKESENPISYIIPEHTCSNCGNVIKEQEESAEALLFTQHRLGAMISS